MASTSCAKQSPVPLKEPAMNYIQYPAPLARYEEVTASPKLFMATLEKLHASMGTKFMIPIIGGRELDLYKLFVEVTSRGGLEKPFLYGCSSMGNDWTEKNSGHEIWDQRYLGSTSKIIRERRWKEVTAIFNFPSTATNASFVLRKYYGSLLHHYEQLYFFKVRGWTPGSSVPLQSPMASRFPAQVTVQPSPEYQAATAQHQRTNTAELCGARAASSGSSQVIGVIDGKFESGYLVTVTIGTEKLKGVLYQAPQNQSCQVPQQYNVSAKNSSGAQVVSRTRRRRRKKNEIKRRDPAHPKPNRSGYNFFFAEQHARLKPLYPGKDREISRMIGELWNKLKETEKAIYQEKAIKDKERYRIEMEDYRERLRTGRVICDAIPLQQWLPEQDVDMVDADVKTDETEGGDSPQTMDNDSSSDESDYENDDKSAEKDLHGAASAGMHFNVGTSNLIMDASAEPAAVEISDREGNIGDMRVENVSNVNNEKVENILVEAGEEKVPDGGQLSYR